jgi:hypothetical protein
MTSRTTRKAIRQLSEPTRSNSLEQQQWGLIITAANIKVEQRVFDIA